MKSKFWLNNKRIVVGPVSMEGESLECKYCMLGEGVEPG
jgi:hypothetical protein